MSWDTRDLGIRDETARQTDPTAATPRVALVQHLTAEPALLLGLDGPEAWPDDVRRAASDLGLWEPRAWEAWSRLVTRGIVSE